MQLFALLVIMMLSCLSTDGLKFFGMRPKAPAPRPAPRGFVPPSSASMPRMGPNPSTFSEMHAQAAQRYAQQLRRDSFMRKRMGPPPALSMSGIAKKMLSQPRTASDILAYNGGKALTPKQIRNVYKEAGVDPGKSMWDGLSVTYRGNNGKPITLQQVRDAGKNGLDKNWQVEWSSPRLIARDMVKPPG